jgi:hypothetical protein
MYREENKDVAEDEHEKYREAVSKLMSKTLTKLFPQPIGSIIIEYALLDKCEHFEAVINRDPEMFKFVWIYNEMLARRNWAHDCPRSKKFIAPTHITPGSVLTFNDGPWRMQHLAEVHGYFEVINKIERKNEDAIVESYRYNAECIRTKSRRSKYENICTQEYSRYLAWMNAGLIDEIDLPRELAMCIAGYAAPDMFEHSVATLRVNPELFSFIWGWNDIHNMPNWYERATSGEPYVRLEQLFPDTMDQFNKSVSPMIGATLALANYGDSDNIGVKDVCAQYRRNAAILLDKTRAIDQIIAP